MRLYRAVSVLELEDIRANQGGLRDSRNKSGKGFFFEREDAVAFGLQAAATDALPHFAISVEVPDDAVRRGTPHIAACEGPGVYLREEDLVWATDLLEEATIE